MTDIGREEFAAFKGDVRLAIGRKRLKGAGRAGLPVLLLVHGSSLSALPCYDLTVPGKPGYSMMEWFARRGFDVWACDHEGYGGSTVTQGNSDVASGVEDLKAVTSFITEQTGQHGIAVYGMSSGALRAAGFTAAYPDRVLRLVLDAFVWTGEGSPTLIERRKGAEMFRTQSRRPIDRDFVLSIFKRDKDGTTEPEVMEACAALQLSFGDSVPTGTYLDMTTKLPIVDPSAVPTPVLIIRGEHDGIATMADILNFFAKLPNPDKQVTVIPGLAHCTSLGIHRERMWRTVHHFLMAASGSDHPDSNQSEHLGDQSAGCEGSAMEVRGTQR